MAGRHGHTYPVWLEAHLGCVVGTGMFKGGCRGGAASWPGCGPWDLCMGNRQDGDQLLGVGLDPGLSQEKWQSCLCQPSPCWPGQLGLGWPCHRWVPSLGGLTWHPRGKVEEGVDSEKLGGFPDFRKRHGAALEHR